MGTAMVAWLAAGPAPVTGPLAPPGPATWVCRPPPPAADGTVADSFGAILLAVLLAVAGGLLAGSFGGWRAARLRPAAALTRVA